MTKLKHRTVEEGRRILSGWEKSGLSQEKFAKQVGISVLVMRYTVRNWKSLARFFEDSKFKTRQQSCRTALHSIALGRKNFLFVGNTKAGENLATLQTLVSTCELHGVNPQDYLTDVLIRFQTHPAAQIEDLLPDKWKPPEIPA